MLQHFKHLLVLAVLVSCGFSAGCDNRPRRVPIAGTVLIDGKPLTRGSIRVIPTGGRAAAAQIDEQGKFRLFTYELNDGVIVGEHPMEIVSTETVGGSGIRWLIPKKYSSVESSGLTLKADEPQDDLQINLTWDGGAPFVERFEIGGDAPPVGAVPMEPVPMETTPAESPPAPGTP